MKNRQRIVAAIKSAMRVALTQIALAILFTTAVFARDVNAQGVLEKRFSVSADDISIRSLIAEVQKQTSVKFNFSTSTINVAKRLSYTADRQRIGDFLSELMTRFNIDYQVIDDQVILYPARKKETLPVKLAIRPVSGIVTDEKGEPVEGITVTEKGKPNSVVTDSKGVYTIQVTNDDAVLVFSSVSYELREVPVGNSSSLNVTVQTANKDMEEVVIIGYGSQKKATVTGAVSTVQGKELLKSPVPNLTNSLTGRLTGVTVTQRSGAPGQNAGLINIRGAATYNNTSAIIIVDGVERSDFGNIDPNEVESITVLKDAASTAIFGIRGANGVIMITTRTGREGRPRITYTGNVSAQHFAGLPKATDAYTNAMLINEANRNDGLPETWSQTALQKFKDGSDPTWYPNINWFDYLTRDYYTQTQHNININGGTKMVKYFVSVGYLFEDGIFKKFESPYGYRTSPSYTRYNFRSNVDFNLSKDLTASVKLSGRLRRRYQPSGPTASGDFSYDHFEGMISRILNTPAFAYPVTFDDGIIAQDPSIGTNIWNPYAVITRWGTRNDDDNNLEGTFQLKYKLDRLTKGLSFRFTFGYDSYFSSIMRRNASWEAYNILDREARTRVLSGDRLRDEPLGTLSVSYSGLINSNLQAGFNYERTFGRHAFTGLVLGTRQVINKNGSDLEAPPRAMQGVVGRITYAYDSRYLLELNAAYNGSENFAPGYQYGFFPAASAGWVLTNEQFMTKFSWLNYFKIRGSYGLVGNDQLDERFLFLNNFSNVTAVTGSTVSQPGSAVRFGIPTSAVTYQAIYQSLFGNPQVTWETGLKSNIGFEATVLNKDLSITFDLFREIRKDILTTRNQGSNTSNGFLLYGATYPAVNVGEVLNRGYEAEVRYHRAVRQFDINFMAQVSYNKNIILNRDEPAGLPEYQKQQGKAVGQFFGYVSEGFYQSQEDINNSPVNTLSTRVIPGDLKFKDINKDGRIDADDRVAIGYSRIPQYTYSFEPSVSFKNITLSVLFQGVARVSSDVILTEQNNGQMMYDVQLGRWTPDNAATATWPALHSRGMAFPSYQLNDFILQDASYLKVRNAEISWNLPRAWVKRLGVAGVRAYCSGQNLHTWTKFKMGLDPENVNLSRSVYQRQAIYPTSRVYNFGVNVSF